jgi:hypothetical protein
MLKSSYTVYVMASEENENMIEVEVAKQVDTNSFFLQNLNENFRGNISYVSIH